MIKKIAVKSKLKSLPFRKIAPNIVTMCALCAGATSIRFSVQENWPYAVFCIFIAAMLDGLDGRVARLLKGSTKFGAELDSLSDFLSFGVAPAILIYRWTLFDLPKFGWFICLLMAIGSALRLARFNTMLDAEEPPAYWHNFFVGVPAPAAALLCIMPVIVSFDFPQSSFLRSNWFCALVIVLIAFLQVSKIPTPSLKKMRIPSSMVLPIMMLVAVFATFIITMPWTTMGISAAIYVVSIPVGIYYFLKQKKEYEQE